MKTLWRLVLIGGTCLAAALGVALILTGADGERTGRGTRRGHRVEGERSVSSTRLSEPPRMPLYSAGFMDDSGFMQITRFTQPVEDESSLASIAASIRGRSRRGLAEIEAELNGLESAAVQERCQLQTSLGLLHLYEGSFAEADRWLAAAVETAGASGLPAHLRANLRVLQGVSALRRGETENCIACIGPSSCIFPLVPEARHQFPDGSRRALGYFSQYLRDRPEDVGVRWLLNVAAMTVGEYPEKVPADLRLSLTPFQSKVNVGRFPNVAQSARLGTRGPNLAGGSVFDDFTGDGLPDVLTTGLDLDRGATLFVNRGDGTFEDRSSSAGLDEQVFSLNCSHADYDNDGLLDVLVLRGGWETAYRLSLLHNKGGGTFADVTLAAGLGEPIACQGAAWGDFDNDGKVDVYVVGEYRGSGASSDLAAWKLAPTQLDSRNFCRLYRNNGDGTFVNVAKAAGTENERFAKGAAWGDFDNDGDLDLFVSNNGAPSRLYRNNGDGTFLDVAPELGLDRPCLGFACWFWDFDNDGLLDIYQNNFEGTLETFVRGYYGLDPPGQSPGRPRLYRNLGREGFRDVAQERGLVRPLLSMGAGFGDIDNDGYLDFYLGTGAPAYSLLVPNVLYKNMGGQRFEDVTASSGTGHLQKGHGVSFADYDNDGDLDLFVDLGGAVPGDQAHNALFQNPGHGRHWIKLKLVGTKSNRAAIGARIRVDLGGRTIHRQVGGGSSFGGNSFVELIGLHDAKVARSITITWPASGTEQIFRGVDADQTLEITEGEEEYRVVQANRARR
jgi:hypothetical protein